jgi:hypothetical protein
MSNEIIPAPPEFQVALFTPSNGGCDVACHSS